MTKVSSTTRDLSMRECPECGSGNGLRTQRMMDEGNRALKECNSCGHHCIINYETYEVEEYEPESLCTGVSQYAHSKPNTMPEDTYTINDFKNQLKNNLEEFTEGIENLDSIAEDDGHRSLLIEYLELYKLDPITRQAFINGAEAFVAFASKRAHIQPLGDDPMDNDNR